MRLACGLAIALSLSFPLLGQTPTAPTPENPSSAQAPADASASPDKKADANAEKKQSDSGVVAGESKKHRRRATATPEGAPRKIVVREGGASEPAAQIVPGMTAEEASRERQNAQQLLGSTDDQLKRLADRVLNAQQQETVGQIRNYMNGARGALQEGDVSRASTLAEKAHLLSDDLLKH